MTAAMLCLALAAVPARALWWGAKAQSVWASAPVALDADEKDWDAAKLDDAEGLGYGFANDDHSLYILVVPHTKQAKEQLGGGYKQTLTLWLDPKAGTRKSAGFALLTPGSGSAAPLQPIYVSTASLPGPALAALGTPDRRMVLEAQLPLAALGNDRPKTISVGIEAGAPDRWPQRPKRPDGFPDEDAFAPLKLWVRVTLAEPKRR